MITGDKDSLEKLAANHVCKQHGKALIPIWALALDRWVLWCPDGELPEEITTRESYGSSI